VKSNLVDIACILKHETPAAWLVHDGDRDIWLPKSQCELEPGKDGKPCIVTMPEWLAQEKELI
jgi:hypothetical protein